LAEEFQKPATSKFARRKFLFCGISKIWAADLVDMQTFSKSNRGVKYLLAVTDTFSKYGWMLPLKDKTGISVSNTFRKILNIENQKIFGFINAKNFTTKMYKSWWNFTLLKIKKILIC